MTGQASVSTNAELVQQRSTVTRLLTVLCLFVFPSLFLFFNSTHNWSYPKTAVVTFITVVVVRAVIDRVMRIALPPPSLWGVDDPVARADDISSQRRYWFWRFWARAGGFYTVIVALTAKHHGGFIYHFEHLAPSILTVFSHPATLLQAVQVVGLFMVNFLIFMGPMLAMGVSQMKLIEPGDAKFGVKLEDVRGQKEAKEEIRRVVEIWQSGEAFEKLGGKRERGMLLVGPAGTGKTMIAKAIATSFNSPIVLMPGSGFAQMFMGLDSIIVRFLHRKAKKASRKWNNTCIVFIDEIDAVGRRRSGLQGGGMGGMMGGMMGGGGMGQMALNQLLVVMDSVDTPPAFKMFWIKKFNLLLDSIYFVPRKIRIGSKKDLTTHGAVGTTSDHPYLREARYLPLRLPSLKPSAAQVYWLGATNIDLEQLDPALIRAGRMGRHIYFRTPTKEDRKDVFDLYLGKVSHEAELDSPERRDELARITQGVSPASIEQICSMSLVNAQNDGRSEFGFDDLVQALTTLEAGTAVGIDYTEDETRAVALHEAGHATAAHIYRTGMESSRLSIKMRGSSLGHHQSFEKEERFGKWRSEDFAELVHCVAAMATEYVFMGENGRGVSGDLAMTSALSRMMVERVGMTPYFTEIPEPEVLRFPGMEPRVVTRTDAEKVRGKFEFIGRRLLVAKDASYGASGGSGKDKEAAEFVGHAFVTAWNFIRLNKDGVERVAERLIEEKEIFGNDLNALLDAQDLKRFDHLDLNNFLDLDAWPVL